MIYIFHFPQCPTHTATDINLSGSLCGLVARSNDSRLLGILLVWFNCSSNDIPESQVQLMGSLVIFTWKFWFLPTFDIVCSIRVQYSCNKQNNWHTKMGVKRPEDRKNSYAILYRLRILENVKIEGYLFAQIRVPMWEFIMRVLTHLSQRLQGS